MTSRLSQMQARFQQKQMQEKEEKLLRLYENQQQRAIERVNRGSAGSNTSVTSVTSVTTSTTQGGKVRQMFDERRQKAGIDRSYPLEPLKTTKSNGYSRGNSLDRLKNDKNASTKTVVKTTVKRSVTHVKNGKPLVNKREVVESIYNNNDGDESYEEHIYEDDNANPPVMNKTYNRHRDLELMMDDHHINANLDDEEFPDVDIDEFDEPIAKPKLSNVGGKLPSQNGVAPKKPVEEKVYMKNGTPPEKTPVRAAAKKETKPLVKKTVTRTVSSPSTNSPTAASPRSSKGLTAVLSPARTVNKVPPETMPASSSSKTSQQKNPRKPSGDNHRAPSTTRPSSKHSGKVPSSINRDDLQACRYCNRRFASDRLGVHEDICARTAAKKRKAYDATKHRVQGTELEPYTRKFNRTTNIKPANRPEAGNPISKQQITKQSKQQQPSKKSDWRRKHEEFISAIRAAKMAQAHVAKGGKLSDLPPPPPSSNPDYVQCPHCGRRFNQTAAERHIPKCATFDFNKPKQASRTNTTGVRNSTRSNTSNKLR